MISVKEFVYTDREVFIFDKIINNECDEDFKFTINQIKDGLKELIKMNIQA